jgi:hypothetical protein
MLTFAIFDRCGCTSTIAGAVNVPLVYWWNIASCTNRRRKVNTQHQKLCSLILLLLQHQYIGAKWVAAQINLVHYRGGDMFAAHSLFLQYTTFVFSPVPEIIDPVFAKTSQNARFLLSENERFGLVFVKTGSINSGTGVWTE